MGILSRLFGGKSPKSTARTPQIGSKDSRSHRRLHRAKDIQLHAAQYTPLPPSPASWELDPREEPVDYPDDLAPIASAGRTGKHTKVLRLAKELTKKTLQGPIGEIVAAAYRDTIHKRMRADQWKPAAWWAAEMLERLPDHADDTDRRRYNKILKRLDREGISHKYDPVDVPPPKREPPFVLVTGNQWRLQGERRLPMDERPDPALKIIAFTADGVVYADFSGKSHRSRAGGGVLLKRDHEGDIIAERQISHDSYRMGVGPSRSGVAIMDSEGTLHVYDERLHPVVRTSLRDDPRVREHFDSTDTNYWGRFRTQVRAVDVSDGGECYLFTLADEAWCCTVVGESRWGVRMPLNEGWERVVAKSDRRSVGAEVEAALATLGLVLPVTSEEVKRAYRKLALVHHPDRNPGSEESVRIMQRINDAFETLTGIDPRSIDFTVQESDVTYFRQVEPDHVTDLEGIRLEIWGMSGPAQDWVYGAAFAAEGAGAFLATYSGKVIEVDASGEPSRVYDLGSVPQEIVDTGEYLYLLTPTRLYVLRDRQHLVSFLDVFRKGKLLVTSTGFGLLDTKSFRWFTPDGQMRGEISTRDPIRAVYDSDVGCVLQTRQHEVLVEGLCMNPMEGG